MKKILIFFLICIAGQLFAQAPPDTVRFPVLLRPGDTFTVQKEYLVRDSIKVKDTLRDSVFKVNVNVLYVLRESQARNLAKKASKQEIDSTMASILEQQVEILKQIRKEKDNVIALNKEGYIHYRDLWDETDRKLEKEEIKSARNFKWGFYVGVGVSALTITALKLIID